LGWLTDILFWHWWVVAALLVILEILRPAYIFLWLGFAAAAIGFLLLVFPSTPGRAQLVMFGLLCLTAVVAWRRYGRKDGKSLNRRG
jgi:membrane protein implicated in regulation of membrane protease activity